MYLLSIDTCRWVKRRPPVLSDCVPIPQRSEDDLYRSMTVIPYLKILHGEEAESEDDEEELLFRVPTSANNCKSPLCKNCHNNRMYYEYFPIVLIYVELISHHNILFSVIS